MSYTKETERFLRVNYNGDVQESFEKLGFAYSVCSGLYVLHKHGEAGLVKDWIENSRDKYNAAGFSEEAEALQYIELGVNDASIDDINKSVTNSGYIRRLVEKLTTIDVKSTVIGVTDV